MMYVGLLEHDRKSNANRAACARVPSGGLAGNSPLRYSIWTASTSHKCGGSWHGRTRRDARVWLVRVVVGSDRIVGMGEGLSERWRGCHHLFISCLGVKERRKEHLPVFFSARLFSYRCFLHFAYASRGHVPLLFRKPVAVMCLAGTETLRDIFAFSGLVSVSGTRKHTPALLCNTTAARFLWLSPKLLSPRFVFHEHLVSEDFFPIPGYIYE